MIDCHHCSDYPHDSKHCRECIELKPKTEA